MSSTSRALTDPKDVTVDFSLESGSWQLDSEEDGTFTLTRTVDWPNDAQDTVRVRPYTVSPLRMTQEVMDRVGRPSLGDESDSLTAAKKFTRSRRIWQMAGSVNAPKAYWELIAVMPPHMEDVTLYPEIVNVGEGSNGTAVFAKILLKRCDIPEVESEPVVTMYADITKIDELRKGLTAEDFCFYRYHTLPQIQENSTGLTH